MTARYIGGPAPWRTVAGECIGCHVLYRIDVNVRRPVCPDCGDPVLRQDAHDPAPPRPAAAGFDQPRIRPALRPLTVARRYGTRR